MMALKVPFKNGSKAWREEYFPEYAEIESQLKIYPSMPPPQGPYVVARKTIPEAAPWSYWSSFIDPAGVVYVTDYSEGYAGYPWTVEVRDEVYRAAMDRMNFFRNGGKTPGGGKGLNPLMLSGGYGLSYESGTFHCAGGTYQFGSGEEADTFTKKDGDVIYVSDRKTTQKNVFPLQYDSVIVEYLTGVKAEPID